MMNEGNDEEEEEGTTTNDTTRDGKGREKPYYLPSLHGVICKSYKGFASYTLPRINTDISFASPTARILCL